MEESVSQMTKFAVSYFLKQIKHCIIFNEDDLSAMYTVCDNQIMLCCDRHNNESIESTPGPSRLSQCLAVVASQPS